MIPQVELFLFVFWKNWRHQKYISNLIDVPVFYLSEILKLFQLYNVSQLYYVFRYLLTLSDVIVCTWMNAEIVISIDLRTFASKKFAKSQLLVCWRTTSLKIT